MVTSFSEFVLEEFSEEPPIDICLADINCSGVVDLEDLGIMKSEFFNELCILTPPKCSPEDTGNCCCQADINLSGTVDLEDLGIMKDTFFDEDCPPCTEPCTFP